MTTQKTKHSMETEATKLYIAFTYFNEHLFESALPEPKIDYTFDPRSDGFFKADKYESRPGMRAGQANQIGINPEKFQGHKDLEVLAELVHNMVHNYEYQLCKVAGQDGPKQFYHTKTWAGLLEDIGLIPTTNLEAKSAKQAREGKSVGQKVSHFIDPAGRFYELAQTFIKETGWRLAYQAVSEPVRQKKNGGKRAKYECGCGRTFNAALNDMDGILCTKCGTEFIKVGENVQAAEQAARTGTDDK